MVSSQIELAMKLKNKLGNATLWQRGDGCLVVCGELKLVENGAPQNSKARCSFMISPKWTEHRPKVLCNEHWVKKEVDWHIYKPWHDKYIYCHIDNSICYQYWWEWGCCISSVTNELGQKAAIEAALAMLLNYPADLLWKHKLAYRYGITKWPKEWDQWGHDVTPREYRMEGRNRAVNYLLHCHENTLKC